MFSQLSSPVQAQILLYHSNPLAIREDLETLHYYLLRELGGSMFPFTARNALFLDYLLPFIDLNNPESLPDRIFRFGAMYERDPFEALPYFERAYHKLGETIFEWIRSPHERDTYLFLAYREAIGKVKKPKRPLLQILLRRTPPEFLRDDPYGVLGITYQSLVSNSGLEDRVGVLEDLIKAGVRYESYGLYPKNRLLMYNLSLVEKSLDIIQEFHNEVVENFTRDFLRDLS